MKEAAETDALPAAALDLLHATHFQPHIGENFVIHFSPDAALTARLKTVLQLPGYSNLERKPFSILLQTDQQTHYYQQAIYTIEHPALGTLPIFLVPVGVQGEGMQYEAVFS